MWKILIASLTTLTLTACQTTNSLDAIPESALRRFTCRLLEDTRVDFLPQELAALSEETKNKAKRNPAAQKIYNCSRAGKASE